VARVERGVAVWKPSAADGAAREREIAAELLAVEHDRGRRRLDQPDTSRAVVDFAQPDSPTMPSTSPLATENSLVDRAHHAGFAV